jgi:ubiquinone/menaquinone biosynthesis C-methylase UbiE
MQHARSHFGIPHHHPHRCPWWIGWALVCPLRRLRENPETLLDPVIKAGQRVLEIGPGMGFFTTTIAERVGDLGRVYCVDVQPKMLDGLRKRLRRQGLDARVETRHCTAADLGISDLSGSIDVAILIHVLHEMQDPRAALESIAHALHPQGRLLLIEPKGHVKTEQFEAELAMAREVGLVAARPPMEVRNPAGLTRLLTLAQG